MERATGRDIIYFSGISVAIILQASRYVLRRPAALRAASSRIALTNFRTSCGPDHKASTRISSAEAMHCRYCAATFGRTGALRRQGPAPPALIALPEAARDRRQRTAQEYRSSSPARRILVPFRRCQAVDPRQAGGQLRRRPISRRG